MKRLAVSWILASLFAWSAAACSDEPEPDTESDFAALSIDAGIAPAECDDAE